MRWWTFYTEERSCCSQETRWNGESARILGAIGTRYKFFWQGCNKGTAGVGVFMAERWIDSGVDVVRVNERIMYVKLMIGKQLINIVSDYAPQVGLSAEDKDNFWDSFIIVLFEIPKQESIFIGSDMNGHVGRDADGYGGVHGGMGFGTRNAEGERILEFGDAVGMVVCNTFFKKEDYKLMVPTISAYTWWNCLATTDASKSRSTLILTVRCSFQRVFCLGSVRSG